MAAYRIRRAKEKDCDAVLWVLKECEKDLLKKGIDMWDYHSRDYVMDKIINREVYLMYEGDKPVGTITLGTELMWVPPYANIDGLFRDMEAKAVYINSLGVLPSYQGKGLGSKLLAFAEKRARAHSIKYVRLCALSTYTELVGFYLNRGYRRMGDRKVSWWKEKGAFFEKAL